MTASPVFLLVNPAAGGGRSHRLRERAANALRAVGPLEVVESTGPRDEVRLAILASRANARALVVLGGDGAVSHAASGLISERSATPLAVIAAGTGNDFVKSLGTPSHDVRAMAALIARGSSRAIDAGRIDEVIFVNAAGFGFDVDVVQRMQDVQARPMLRGTARYVFTALQQLFRYRGFVADAGPVGANAAPDDVRHPWMLLVFANGRHFGGAFHIAPGAALDNGVLDMIGIRDIPPLTRARLFARATRGTHLTHAAITSVRGTTHTVRFAERPCFQADGELHRARSTTVVVVCLPGALRVITV